MTNTSTWQNQKAEVTFIHSFPVQLWSRLKPFVQTVEYSQGGSTLHEASPADLNTARRSMDVIFHSDRRSAVCTHSSSHARIDGHGLQLVITVIGSWCGRPDPSRASSVTSVFCLWRRSEEALGPNKRLVLLFGSISQMRNCLCAPFKSALWWSQSTIKHKRIQRL